MAIHSPPLPPPHDVEEIVTAIMARVSAVVAVLAAAYLGATL